MVNLGLSWWFAWSFGGDLVVSTCAASALVADGFLKDFLSFSYLISLVLNVYTLNSATLSWFTCLSLLTHVFKSVGMSTGCRAFSCHASIIFGMLFVLILVSPVISHCPTIFPCTIISLGCISVFISIASVIWDDSFFL